MIQNTGGPVTTSGLTMSTARLLGRSTASTGAVEEITVGSGLTLSAGTLTATGGGGGTPAGSSGDLQYNNAGAFGATTGVTFPGTGRLSLAQGTITTAISPLTITETRNASGVAFPGIVYNITNTASQGPAFAQIGSLFADFQVAGSSQLRIRRDGALLGLSSVFPAAFVPASVRGNSGWTAGIAGNGESRVCIAADGVTVVSANLFGWTASPSDASAAVELALYRDAANTLAQRNGANAQESRIYGTFTGASDYRRIAVGMSTAGVGFIRPEGAGAGASGNILLISTGATTVASLPAAGTAGRRAFVTDSNATTFAAIVAGGGSNGVPVYDDGTNWRIG